MSKPYTQPGEKGTDTNQASEVLQGDCLELMKDIPSGSVDMVLTDPPYGTTACKWDSVIPFEPMWEQLKRIIKPNGAIVLFGSQPFTSALVMSNPKMFKYSWYWEKSKPSNFLNAKKQPMRKVEDILVFCKKSTVYYPQGLVIGKQNSNSGRENTYGAVKKSWTQDITYTNYPHNILRYPNVVGSSAAHPTQKPVALMEYLIKTYTSKGETVLDFTMGSGTTGVACVNTDRRFIGIELDEGYFDMAKKRIDEATN